MDPLQFIWEVAQALFSLIAAVAVPALVIWWIARRNRAASASRQRPRREQ